MNYVDALLAARSAGPTTSEGDVAGPAVRANSLMAERSRSLPAAAYRNVQPADFARTTLDPRERPEVLTERDRDWRALARERDRLPAETRWRVPTDELVRGLVREWRDA